MGEDDFASFVAGRWTSLYRLAYLMTGSRQSAEDLVQSALEKAYADWKRIGKMEGPEPYVRRIIANAVFSQRRRLSWRREELRGDDLPEKATESFERAVGERSELWPLVLALPPRQRAVIVLRYYEDLDEEAIAEVLGCSRGTVKSQASDAMRALRRAFAASGHTVAPTKAVSDT